MSSINFFTGVNPAFSNVQKADMFGRKQRSFDSGPASILNGTFDPIAQKRQTAQKRAYKIVSDAYAGDKKIDDDVQNRRGLIEHYERMYGEASQRLKEIEEGKEALRQEYNIDPDSQEQKDLEILEKYQNVPDWAKADKKTMELWMTPEALDRAEELHKQGYGEGYTEYQQRVLELDKGVAPQKEKLKDALKGLIEENGAIRGIALERLKYHHMVDAQLEADDIMEKVSDEIKGILMDEAVDHVDEKFEEELEEAEEKKEEQKEEEEKLEEIKERREELEALMDPEKAQEEHRHSDDGSDTILGDGMTEAMLKMDSVKEDVKQQVADMVTKMKLVAEDVKGIKVDELL